MSSIGENSSESVIFSDSFSIPDTSLHDAHKNVNFRQTYLTKSGYKPSRHNKVTTEDILKAIRQEKWFFYLLKTILGKRRTSTKSKDGSYRIWHNNFDIKLYSCGYGIDMKIYQNGKLIIVIEFKNWNTDQTRTFDGEHIFPRFTGFTNDVIKILVISSKSLLTEETLQQLHDENIQIFESGYITEDNKAEAYRQFSSRYYTTLKKMLGITHKPCVSPPSVFNVVNSLVTKSNVTTNPNTNYHVPQIEQQEHNNTIYYTLPIIDEKVLMKQLENQYGDMPNWWIWDKMRKKKQEIELSNACVSWIMQLVS